jgi:CubicO group peptidase (beta-lactamase class C family)
MLGAMPAKPSRLAALGSQVDALFAPWQSDATPGAAVGVFLDGEIVHARGYGMASVELGVPNTPSTVFEIESTSKQFAAACIAILDGTESFSLDDDIREIVPEVSALPRITAR